MSENIKKIINNSKILDYINNLNQRIHLSMRKNKSLFNADIIEAIQQSPKTKYWIKDNVIPLIYQGNEGLTKLLNETEKEKNIVVFAVKLQIIIEILNSLPDSLNNIKEDVDSGEYDLEKNLKKFEEEKIPFKKYH